MNFEHEWLGKPPEIWFQVKLGRENAQLAKEISLDPNDHKRLSLYFNFTKNSGDLKRRRSFHRITDCMLRREQALGELRKGKRYLYWAEPIEEVWKNLQNASS